MNSKSAPPSPLRERLLAAAPGLRSFLRYERGWLRNDLIGGLSVAAIAMPVGIAYADLAGVPTIVGIYSAIFPLFAYALFGSSRQLIVGPDTATCLIVAASLGPLAAGDPARYATLLSVLTLMTAAILIAAGLARFGFMANFLSQPILTGYLNGVALIILIGQLPKLLGIPIDADGLFPTLAATVDTIERAHLPSCLLGIVTLAFLGVMSRVAPSFPAPLLAVAGGIVAANLFDPQQYGLSVLGEFSRPVPAPPLPRVDMNTFQVLLTDAAGISLVSFTSGVLTAKSFARRNRYPLDANQELVGFGAANIATWLTQGFPVTGTSSRTAVNDAVKGKTQLVGVVAGGAMLLSLVFLAKPLGSIPLVSLAAVVVMAAFSLLDLRSLRELYATNPREMLISITTTLAVLFFGVLTGVLVAVSLSLLWLLAVVSRPRVSILGRLPDVSGYHSVDEHPSAATTPGLVIVRFDGNLIFFNADYFRESLRQAISGTEGPVKYVILDASPISVLDTTGFQSFLQLREELATQGIRLVVARSKRVVQRYFTEAYDREVTERHGEDRFYSIAAAVRAFDEREGAGD